MKRIIFMSALLVLLLSACGSSVTAVPTSVPLPVLVVDGAHMTNPGLAYQIPVGDGFVLDASSFDFGTATGPNAVQVVFSGRAYQTTWMNGATSQSILAVDLVPVVGSSRLTTFAAGEQLIVSIGSIAANGRFSPMWVAVVDVK